MADKTQRISLTLDPVDLEYFEKMSRAAGVSKSRLIRQAMREFREKYGDKEQAALDLTWKKLRASS